MKIYQPKLLLIVGLVIGCRSAAAQITRLPEVARDAVTARDSIRRDPDVQLVADEHSSTAHYPQLLQPAESELLPAAEGSQEITLSDLETSALASNPAIAQAAARIRALRGKCVQAGLPPNPSIGYLASEIGDSGRAGQQGGYVGQEFITGGKLSLNRAVVSQEILHAEQQLAAVQLRVRTDVRKSYYNALVAQRRAEVADELVSVSNEGVATSERLIKAQQIPRAALLQTEVEQQNAAISAHTAANQSQAAWRQLSAVVGADLPVRHLAGDVTKLPELIGWDQQLLQVTMTSPETASAQAELSRTKVALQRARVEPVPDLTTQFSVQRDNATGDTIAGVQVGVPLPLWNRNQGGISQAEAEVTEARRNAERIELDLKWRLAAAYQEYSNARTQADAYQTQVLPKSKETYQLVQRGYSLGELGYLDLLSAQRTYSQTNLAYLDALGTLWRSWADIDGLLLSESLAQPPQ